MAYPPAHRAGSVIRALRRLLAGLAALLLLAALAWAWLWHSEAGGAFVLTQVRAALGNDALKWDSAEGTLTDGVQLRGLVFTADGLDVTIAQAELAVMPGALWRGVLRIVPLQFNDVRISFTSAPTDSDKPPVWPSSWPELPLPLAVEMPALHLRALQLQRDGASLPPVSAIDGGLRVTSHQVHVTALTIRRAEETTHVDGRIDLGVRSAIALMLDSASVADAATAWQLRARITGTPADMQVAIEGDAPGPVSVHAHVREDSGRLRWQLTTRAQDIAPSFFGGPAGRFDATLDVDGIDAFANVSGQLQREGQALHIQPSQVSWQDGQISLSPLVLSVLGGEVRINGEVGTGGDAAVMALDVEANSLQWGSGAGRVTAAGSARVTGTLAQWQLDGNAGLNRQTLAAQLVLRAHGDRQRVALDQLRLKTDAGQSLLSGELVYSPAIRWQTAGTIAGFDPGFFAPDYPGSLSANISSYGAMADDQLQLTVDLDALSGHVRDRAVKGRARLEHHAGRSSGALDLHVGASHVTASGQHDTSGNVPATLQAKFSPLHLDDLLPDASGSLNGKFALSGTDRNAVIRGDIHGERLSWNRYCVDALQWRASPSTGTGSHSELSLAAAAINGVHVARLKADVLGTPVAANWSLQASTGTRAVQAAGRWQQTKALRRFDLSTLSLSSAPGDHWQLLGPASLTLGDAMALSSLCLQQASARVCMRGNWPGELTGTVHALDLSIFDPLLQRGEVSFGLEGRIDGNVTLGSDATQVTHGKAQLRFSPGAVQVSPRGKQPALAWQAITVDAALAGDAVEITLDAKTSAEGALRGQLATGLDADAALTGWLDLDVAQLAWLELLSPDIAAPSGHLRGQLTVAGSRRAPRLSGQVLLEDFAAEVPALGIALARSRAQLDAGTDGNLHLDARLDSGDGPLRVVADGSLADTSAFKARLSGERVKVIDNADLRAWVSPELEIVRAEGGFSVTGRLLVPEAHIALDKMQAGAAARSLDVQILDPDEVQSTAAPVPVALDVRALFGTAVELTGFGLDGKLGGELHVTQLPGDEPLGTGTLNVSGSYQRYGKPLTIRRARLTYTRTPLDNPALDIRAERSIDTQMVGVQVFGSALDPVTTLVSNPALDNSETLSWLVLGRPLRSAQQGDGDKLNAAASALGAGGNLLAKQLGVRLGLDTAAVGESRTLGVNTLSIGKFISPRLYISYGVSLLGAGQVVALKYLLGKGFELEVESGQESRGSLNWKTER